MDTKERLPRLSDFGIDEGALLVDLNKQTMTKLIAAEKTIERMKAALLKCSEFFSRPENNDLNGSDEPAIAVYDVLESMVGEPKEHT